MSSTNHTEKAQVVYFSHGGGPLPILGDPGHKAMVDFMQRLPSQLRKPEAILVISAHWEEAVATLIGGSRPPLFYDSVRQFDSHICQIRTAPGLITDYSFRQN